MVLRLFTINETGNMRMPDGLEDLDLGIKVLLQLLVEPVDVHGLDSDSARRTFLHRTSAIMTFLLHSQKQSMLLEGIEGVPIKNAALLTVILP